VAQECHELSVSRDVPAERPLHRYCQQLPASYQFALHEERSLQLRALRVLADAITLPDPDGLSSRSCEPEDMAAAEGYERPIERDLASFEKGLSRFLDLKYELEPEDYPHFVSTLLRGATTIQMDMGLRAKLARAVVRVVRKRSCVLKEGMPWRPILNIIKHVHVDCINGGPFVGKDVRDAHCRSMLALLRKCRNFVQPGDSADQIWECFGPDIDPSAPNTAFEPLLFLAHVLPTRGKASLSWMPRAFSLFPRLSYSSDWDAVWLALFGRVAKHQPCVVDWTDALPYMYSRIVASFRLPLGPDAPQSPTERRCPHHCTFMLSDRTIAAAATIVVYTQSPRFPEAALYFERLLSLVENFFHPSNGGRWTSYLGSFLQAVSSYLAARVTAERGATKAGVDQRVLGDAHQVAIAPAEDRLSDEYVDKLVGLLLPLVQQGLHSKHGSMTIQAATASRELATISPQTMVEPLLSLASECLESVSSPHRTTAALKLLASLTPVFLDPVLYPSGTAALPHALTLTLPGIDANDPSKTESTLRFIAGAAARIQSVMSSKDSFSSELAYFLDEYTHQLLERIFSLLDSLEAPPRKGRHGSVPSNTGHQLSIFIFIVSMENLFAAVPPGVAQSAAERVSTQISGSASLNAIKFYGALVRSVAGAAASSSPNKSSAAIFIPRLLDQLLVDARASVDDQHLELAPLSEDELVWRLRMLAQVCRVCGSLESYNGRISKVISLAFGRSERPVYKAGGRLLRGLLEGLTSIQSTIGEELSAVHMADEHPRSLKEDQYDIHWKIPSLNEWKLAENIMCRFLEDAEELCVCESGKTITGAAATQREIKLDRDVLFRVLRMLHAVQRGGRWIMAGVISKPCAVLEADMEGLTASNTLTGNGHMSKFDALSVLRRPILAGLGGERRREHSASSEVTATNLWRRTYQLIADILGAVISQRPDDGALLYRCLEPIELAHESFRRNHNRMTAHACRGYKAAYKPVIAAKRNYGAEGGAGRSMPRFIFKLRVEALQELRLSLAARPGIEAKDSFESMTEHAIQLSVNAFPRVRSEARGILTRAWRVAHPRVRRRQILEVIDHLASAASAASTIDANLLGQLQNGSELPFGPVKPENSVNHSTIDLAKGKDPLYEVMIGASGVLRSAAAAPLLMRDWDLFDRIARVLLTTVVVAERPDAAGAVGSLFVKLAGLARPLSIQSFRLVDGDLNSHVCVAGGMSGASEETAKLSKFNDFNLHLLDLLRSRSIPPPLKSDGNVQTSRSPLNATGDSHWRLQSLVATLLSMCIRVDLPPPPEVATFFAESMVSDVASLRQIAVKSVALILSLHGQNSLRTVDKSFDVTVMDSARSLSVVGAIEEVISRPGYGKLLVGTLALDRDDGMGLDSSGGGGMRSSGLGLMSLSRYVDGDACWAMISGPPWPMSWVARSPRDMFNISQVRFYEALFRVYGSSALCSFTETLNSMVTALENKEEKIIEGVRDDNARVIVSEVVAGLARGLRLGARSSESEIVELIYRWSASLMDGMTGPEGAINGGCLVRLILTSSPGTVGSLISSRIVDSIVTQRPLVAPMDNGSAAHLQARRLRYIHACVADLLPGDLTIAPRVLSAAIPDLTSQIAFGHELKSVREEIARLLSMLASFSSQGAAATYRSGIETVASRQTSSVGADIGNGDSSTADVTDETVQILRKAKSRQGETLSRWVSVVYWNGDALCFGKYLPTLLPAIVSSLDEESDQDRVKHARLALSLAAQGVMNETVVAEIVRVCELISKSARYRVRGALLPFLQVLSFCRLFTATEETLASVRKIVTNLLSDQQLEVRDAAASTLVPLIRDAPAAVTSNMRDEFASILRSTAGRGHRGRRLVLEGEVLCRRHGAVLGLSSMVMSRPYQVPPWMPSVLVQLAACINDAPPISASTRKLFADFMRTHRDEWSVHKRAFSEDELECVSELMVSPSYYA
jgi:Proteasome-substrate-size regulator, mid region/Domain of unknown function (DUF3437)